MEETHEAREYQREIGNLLANQLTLEEEDAVQAELLELEAANLEPPIQPMLPSAPKEQPVVHETEEHASLVQAQVAMGRVAVPG